MLNMKLLKDLISKSALGVKEKPFVKLRFAISGPHATRIVVIGLCKTLAVTVIPLRVICQKP
jgi:hypothetical protein